MREVKRKPVAKKPAAKKTVGKILPKMTVHRKAAEGSGMTRASRRVVKTAPSGFQESPSGVYIPISLAKPVPPSNFSKGLKAAKSAITSAIEEFGGFLTQDMDIAEIELSASISAKGEFLGFGVAGDASVKIKIRPAVKTA
jgi:hypothetical protein